LLLDAGEVLRHDWVVGQIVENLQSFVSGALKVVSDHVIDDFTASLTEQGDILDIFSVELGLEGVVISLTKQNEDHVVTEVSLAGELMVEVEFKVRHGEVVEGSVQAELGHGNHEIKDAESFPALFAVLRNHVALIFRHSVGWEHTKVLLDEVEILELLEAGHQISSSLEDEDLLGLSKMGELIVDMSH
jgi:hypothetical protein